MIYFKSMTTTVTTKNMVSIPVDLARMFGIKPGYTFDWSPTGRPEEIIVRVVPDRQALSRRLMGAGAVFSPSRTAVSELVQERAEDPA
jgi:bifunctional DNA-binding transcriptional regulator/antitoxin component of YhaV-PrlF toxin-antitoxin module